MTPATERVLRLFVAFAFVFISAPFVALAQKDQGIIPLRNWTVPPFTGASASVRPMTHTVGNTPAVFVPFGPCRLTDSRVSAGGPGPIQPNSPQDYDFVASGCPNIPGLQTGDTVPDPILAWSLNFTVINTLGPGFLYTYPTGGAPPPVATLNYTGSAGELRNNAAIVIVNSATGSFTVATGVNGTDVIIDTNGIFLATLEPSTQFVITGNFSGGGAIRGQNSSTGAGSSGVYGLASGTTGAVYGVFGQSSSMAADSAGTRGVDGTGAPAGATSIAPAGVRGESTTAYGLLGLSRFVGVRGDVLNTTGASLAEGRLGYAVSGTNYGVYSIGDIGATGTKSFVLPHPTDPSLVIRYVSLEGPEAGTYFRGRGRVSGRLGVIDVPESFRFVTEPDSLSIQLTPIGGHATLWVADLNLDQIVIQGSRDVEFFYTVNGVRRDYGGFQAIAQGSEFVPESPAAHLPQSLPASSRRNLITNGTYNEDGTVNLETAQRLSWTRIWATLPSRVRE